MHATSIVNAFRVTTLFCVCDFVYVFRWLRKEIAAQYRDPGGCTSPTVFYLSSTGRTRCTDRTCTFLLSRK